MRRLAGALAVGLLVVAGCSATGGDGGGLGSPASSVAAGAAKTGVAMPFNWVDGKGQVTIHSMKWVTKGATANDSPPENGSYLVMDVSVEATSGSISVNPLYVVGVDQEGHTYDALSGSLGGFKPKLDSSELAAGKKRRGLVALDMPRAAGSSVEYQSPLGDTLVEWKVPA